MFQVFKVLKVCKLFLFFFLKDFFFIQVKNFFGIEFLDTNDSPDHFGGLEQYIDEDENLWPCKKHLGHRKQDELPFSPSP